MNLEKLLEFDYKLSHNLRVAEKPGVLRQIAQLIGHSGDSWSLVPLPTTNGQWSV
jgi:hypothetical protein